MGRAGFASRMWFVCLEGILVLAVLLGRYTTGIQSVPFTGDESHWIHTSVYWEILLQGDPYSKFWSETYWTLTQPPMTRYIIGFTRSLAGFTPEGLNTPWQFDMTDEENRLAGSLPGDDLLWWSRLPMTVLAALVGLILFLLLKRSAGRLSAYAFIIFFAISPYFLLNLRRAMSESPLLFFVVLCCGVTYLAVEHWIMVSKQEVSAKKELLKTSGLYILAGLCAGLAGLSKINGLLMAGGVALACLAAVVVVPGRLSRNARFSFLVRTGVLLIFTALGVFILLNPYLYIDPLNRMGRMLKFRVQEMSIQMAQFPQQHITGLKNHIWVPVKEIFFNLAPLRFRGALVINTLFNAAGIAALIRMVLPFAVDEKRKSAALTLLVTPLPMIAAALGSPLNWDRYFMLPVLFSMVYFSIGLGWGIQWVLMKTGIFRTVIDNSLT